MIELLSSTGLGSCIAIVLCLTAILTAAMRGRRR